MNRSIIATSFFAVVLALTGCVSTNAAMLGSVTSARPKLLANQVALYRLANQVPGQYEEVALLNSSGDSGFTNEARMFESMKKKAGELGANGVILDAVSEPSSGAKVAAAIFGVSAQRKGKAIAIYIFPNPTSASNIISEQPTKPSSAPQPPATAPCVACQNLGRGL